MFIVVDAVLGGEKVIAVDQISKLEHSTSKGAQITLKDGTVLITKNPYEDVFQRVQRAYQDLLKISQSKQGE